MHKYFKTVFIASAVILSLCFVPTVLASANVTNTEQTEETETPDPETSGPENPDPENPDPENPDEPTLPVVNYPESMKNGSIPTIYINTENYVPIVDKETKIPATLYIDASMSEELNDLGSAEKPVELTIKGRGNSSWIDFSKKPYKLKFEKKQAPLGLTKSKHFALLAEVNVRCLTSYWGFEVGRQLGMEWAPAFQPVELILNGNYEGLYMLIESIKIQDDRVNIWEQPEENTDPETIPYGWLIEFDNYKDDYQVSILESPGKYARITHKSPEIISDEQRSWLINEFKDIFARLKNDDIFEPTWPEKLDIHSLAQYFIVSELQGNKDAYTGSFYFHKDIGENAKWIAGPLWDLDYATYDEEWVFNLREDWGIHIIKEALQYPVFLDEVKKLWQQVTPEFLGNIYDGMKELSDIITPVIEHDKIRWPEYSYNSNIHLMGKLVIPVKYKFISDNLDSLYPETTGASAVESATSSRMFVRNGVLYIADAENVAYFSLSDLCGRRVSVDAASQVNLNSLPAGVYIVSAIYRDGQHISMKYSRR